MATKEEPDNEFPESPENFSDENLSGQESDQGEPELPPDNKDHVSKLLKQLQNSGAVIKKTIPVKPPEPIQPPSPLAPPSKEYKCITCTIDFPDWDSLEEHLLQHVTLPKIIVDRLPSDEESEPDYEPGDDYWTDDENTDVKPKIDVTELLKNKYLSIKQAETSPSKPPDALSKLAGLGGFTIKKNNTPVKKNESEEDEPKDELMQKLGKLGGLKLKLQTTTQGNANSFKVVNGLKEFNAEDEDEWSGKEDEADCSGESEETDKPAALAEPTPEKKPTQTTPIKPNPNVKVTNVVRILPKPPNQANLNSEIPSTTQNFTMNEVVVKNEPDEEQTNSNPPNISQLSTNEVKRECPTPPIIEVSSVTSIKTETEEFTNTSTGVSITEITDPAPIQPKKENTDPIAIIEINGDSNDEDDDCCVVSATPAADIKPKIENVAYPPCSMPYTSQQPQVSSASMLGSRMAPGSTYSTEKQHNFNWNAPDQKQDLLEKSADAIFENLLASSNHKKEPSLSEPSEYISLDNLHTCEICNTRFTDTTMLENHRRMTGHSKSLVSPVSSSLASALLPSYSSPSNSLLSSLFPVKQLADQVGRLSTSSAGQGGPYQQNMIINIQAYPPGQGMSQQQPYGAYPGQQPGPAPNYGGGNMFRMPGQPVPGQPYPGQFTPGQYSPQSYPGPNPGFIGGNTNNYSQSPLQGMQQQVYGPGGQPIGVQPMGVQPMGVQPGQMGMSPGQGPSGQMGAGQVGFAPPSSPNSMKPPPPPGNIRIQNVQSFSPGQSPGQVRSGAPIRGVRPRMPGAVRPGMRPSVRPGVQVQGAVRGMKPGPRMAAGMKRPAGANQTAGGKKRMDMLIPGKHDNEDCTVMSMQKQRDGLPMIHSVQGSKDNFGLGSGISVTKKTVNKEASGMASLLASRGIMVKQKPKSRSPSPERPLPHIPNLGAGVSIKHTSKNSQFSIPEAKVGGGAMNACRICKKMFMSSASLSVHMSTAHPGSKLPLYKCEECPASYPKSAQLQHHRRVFHNVSGPDRELGLPVVDLSIEENLKRLSDLGIYSFIPLANREQASGCFGIPVISVHNMNNGMVRGLTALGADGLLSLGPLKPLPNT